MKYLDQPLAAHFSVAGLTYSTRTSSQKETEASLARRTGRPVEEPENLLSLRIEGRRSLLMAELDWVFLIQDGFSRAHAVNDGSDCV